MSRLRHGPPSAAVVLDHDEPIWVFAGLGERNQRPEHVHLGIAAAIWRKELWPSGEPMDRFSFLIVIWSGYLGIGKCPEEVEGFHVSRARRRIWLREGGIDRKIRL